ncbi:MAG TPA: cytochrome c-type biogenesis CcmF C-terminal domain-containing protein, partial [Terriglobales bacterium]|nr:cytochrome c-type biogenesis CcmF C-terminal domain-containing protein [Terriglobales bacterium]
LPIGMFLLLLTAVGPLLAWRKTSVESLKRNFLWPAVAAVATAVLLIALGMRPWQDSAVFYSLMAISLSVLVTATVASEFIRGGRVIAEKTGQNLLGSMVQLTRRNTRRYGGYVVHFGVVVIVIGIAGSAFNQQNEAPLGMGDRMSIGPYTLVGRSYTQDDNPNYASELAVVDVYKGGGNKIDTMYPERRMYKASGQTATMVANRSTPKEDLYLVYAGRNEENGPPIIRAHLNPLVMWIWVGVYVVIFGTLLALVPNATAVTLRQPVREPAAAAVEAGD